MGKAEQTTVVAVPLSPGAVTDRASVQKSWAHEYGRMCSEALLLWLSILALFFPPMGLDDSLPKDLKAKEPLWKITHTYTYTCMHTQMPTHTSRSYVQVLKCFRNWFFNRSKLALWNRTPSGLWRCRNICILKFITAPIMLAKLWIHLNVHWQKNR